MPQIDNNDQPKFHGPITIMSARDFRVLRTPEEIECFLDSVWPINEPGGNSPTESQTSFPAAGSADFQPEPEPEPTPNLAQKAIEVVSKFLIYGGVYLISRPYISKIKGAIVIYKGVKGTGKFLHRFGKQTGLGAWEDKLIDKMQAWTKQPEADG